MIRNRLNTPNEFFLNTPKKKYYKFNENRNFLD